MEDDSQEKKPQVLVLPQMLHFLKTYAASSEVDLQRALSTYKMYESKEAVKRLQNELISIKASKVAPAVLDRVISKRRITRYGSYERFAELMILWLLQAKT
ncbi:hypothetical protein JNK13_03735 [bacterium]|nr:hypothetical protein [bacterium]